jgi:5-methylcytosine-specific restriction endonuclease McrA
MWLRLSDSTDDDPVILNVCATRTDQAKVLGWLVRLMLYAAKHGSDGYLPDLIFRDIVRSKVWRYRLTSPPNGGTALLHRRGDVCECLKDRPQWPDTAADVFIHHYLMWNPTKDETDVARAKQAELRDRELQAAVRMRDQGRCRYCGVKVIWADRRSAQGGVYDHVDPARAGGAANLVVACRGCNSRKGARTPAAAGMTLLPVPGSESGSERDLTPTTWSGADATTHVPVRDGTGRVTTPATPGDAGPAGDRNPIGPPTPRRSSLHTDPHRRSALADDPTDHAGLPTPADLHHASDIYNAFTETDDP